MFGGWYDGPAGQPAVTRPTGRRVSESSHSSRRQATSEKAGDEEGLTTAMRAKLQLCRQIDEKYGPAEVLDVLRLVWYLPPAPPARQYVLAVPRTPATLQPAPPRNGATGPGVAGPASDPIRVERSPPRPPLGPGSPRRTQSAVPSGTAPRPASPKAAVAHRRVAAAAVCVATAEHVAAAAPAAVTGSPAKPLPPQPPPVLGPRRPESDDTWLTGMLIIKVHCATDLSNPAPGAHRVWHRVVPIEDLPDTYVRVVVDGLKKQRTSTVKGSRDPKWEERMIVALVGEPPEFKLAVKNDNPLAKNQTLGEVTLDLSQFIHKDHARVWLPLSGPSNAELCISTTYIDTSARCPEVPEQAFPLRPGCRVTLYNDAHSDPHCPLPANPFLPGLSAPTDCWDDVHAALSAATRFIYITGWSVWTEVRLLRPETGQSETLGELLKRKAEEGVKVRMMIWDDMTSLNFGLLNQLVNPQGLMGTHDEETACFFGKTGVVCKKVANEALGYRASGQWHNGNVRAGTAAGAMLARNWSYSHHQKTIICDAEGWQGPQGPRRVVAFLGGLDLASGRYDTPTHSLFGTLHTVHKDDFYQPCHPGLDPRVGPRQPWHDIHCRLEGPVARDVLQNFEDRWLKQAEPNTALPTSLLHNLEKDPELASPFEDHAPAGEAWAVQMFRSIDTNSALNVSEVENGCHNAYVWAIRQAQRFIYLENQYFMGGAMAWEGFDDRAHNVECKQIIPVEIAMRIATKIRRGEPFSVYMVLPLFPEGRPDTAASQGMLFWQAETFRMMYRKIADAIHKWGPRGAHPTHYLSVFFLGNREPDLPVTMPSELQGRLREAQQRLLQSRRHQIYVHSKMAIFDDEYVIVGSANINQRSMDGTRDTEIAVGGYEVAHRRGPDRSLPRGHVAALRLRLWAEHLGKVDPVFLEPDSPACVQAVRSMAAANWRAYSDDTPRTLPHGHLCTYPYVVHHHGRLSAAVETFPDEKGRNARVLGKQPPVILQFLTT
eukprot:EG_transcript_1604